MADNTTITAPMKLHILLEEKENINLMGTLLPDDTETVGLVWSSDNEVAAVVSEQGIVTGIKEGTAKITVRTADSSFKDSVMILVMAREATGLRLSILLKPAETCRLIAVFANNKESVVWASNDTAVATVDENGKVTAAASGLALITLTSKDGEKTDQVYIRVKKTDGSNLDPSEEDDVTELNTESPVWPSYEIPQKYTSINIETIKKTAQKDSEVVVSEFEITGMSESSLTRFNGALLGPKGNLFMIPMNTTGMHMVNILNIKSKQIVDQVVGLKSNSAVLAPDGQMYLIPEEATTIMRIDTRVVRSGESFGAITKSFYCGGVLASNGNIYAMPNLAKNVLEINPVNKTISSFGSIAEQDKYFSSVLAPNGKIYGIPYQATNILEIDPVNKKVTTFGWIGENRSYKGGVLAPNGKIYAIPYNADAVLEIDPETKNIVPFGRIELGEQYSGGVLAPNGKIYAVPFKAKHILEIDPIKRTVKNFAESDSYGHCGGVLADDGKIYCTPNNDFEKKTILVIDTGWRYKDPSVCLSPYLNKF